MAMLAERKSKQKWSHDPRNKAWSTNTDRFGYQMLTKMGWSVGKGLGANESGATSHVKVSLKNNNLGVGAKASQDDNWLAHQDDFNDLLAHLNKANSNDGGNEDSECGEKSKDMETIARRSRKRVFYQRFIKSKNTSSYSAEDMACIMGQRSKSAPESPMDLSENEDSEDSCASCPVISKTHDPGMTTITSKHSIQDYFAMKMAELKEKRMQESSASQDTSQDEKGFVEETLEETSPKKKKKPKKRKLDKDEHSEATKYKIDEEDPGKNEEISISDKIPKKKKKKLKKRKLEEVEEDVGDLKDGASEDKGEGSSNDNDKKQKDTKQKKKKEKRERKKVEIESCYELRDLEDNKKNKSEKKEECSEKRKKKRNGRKRNLDEESSNQEKESISKKNQKSKRVISDDVENENKHKKKRDLKEKNEKKKEKRSKDAEKKVKKKDIEKRGKKSDKVGSSRNV